MEEKETMTIKAKTLSTFAVTLLLLLASPLDVSAEESSLSTVEAATRLTRWFQELLKPFEEIGATAEKQNLIDALVDLNRDLFEVEQEKRYAITALKRRPLVRAELQRASASINEKLTRLRQSLLRLGPKLRVAYRKGGDETVSLLSQALNSTNAFVFNLSEESDASADQSVRISQEAVVGFDRAQISLADVIANLQK